MSDLISREKLKKDIKRIENLPWGDEDGNRVDFVWSPKELEHMIDHQPSAQEWIPVSERVPEDGEEVLATVWVDDEVYIENVVYTHGRWDSIYEHYELEVYGRNRNSDVLAWQPLPEPYKQNEGGKA